MYILIVKYSKFISKLRYLLYLSLTNLKSIKMKKLLN